MGRPVKIILQPIKFRKVDHVAVLCPDNSRVDELIRELENAEWSTGYRFWHLPLKKHTLKQLAATFKGIGVIDKSAFNDFEFQTDEKSITRKRPNRVNKPGAVQRNKIRAYCISCKSKGYSEGTIKVYQSLLNVFFGFYHLKHDEDITIKDVENFMVNYIMKNDLSSNYRRLMKNTLRRYFTYTGHEELSAFLRN